MSLARRIGALFQSNGANPPTLSAPGAINEAASVALASAATVNIGAALSNNVSVTGTTTITAFDTVAAGTKRTLTFAGALVLTHNATSLILPGGASITSAAGDVAEFVSLGSGNWRCEGYERANGRPVLAPTLGAAAATTSGTVAEFTGIPSWANRITLLLDSVSTNGSSIPIVQIGTSGGFETSGYVGANGGNAGAAGAGGATPASGHGLTLGGGATFVYTGAVVLTRISGNKWIITNTNTYSASNAMNYGASVKTLGGVLDRVRLTTVNGTDAFDAGSVNILYE